MPLKKFKLTIPKKGEVCVITMPECEIRIYGGTENGKVQPDFEADAETKIRYETLTPTEMKPYNS